MLKKNNLILKVLTEISVLYASSQDQKHAALSNINIIERYTQAEYDALETTTLIRSKDSPTGYFVSFLNKDSNPSHVRIYGEWRFTDAAHSSLWTFLNASPEEWQIGYFVYSSGPLPTTGKILSRETGVWSHTISLPYGSWNYLFYICEVEGASFSNITDLVRVWDPFSSPLLYNYQADDMLRDETLSQVFVPYDEERQSLSDNYTAEAPRNNHSGSAFFADVPYEDNFKASFGIYLPNGYDSKCPEPYPVLVLFHGGGRSESAWFNLGKAINILDNTRAEGRVESIAVVSPNANDLSLNWLAIMYLVLTAILPYMKRQYNINADSRGRAISGLSMGSRVTTNLLYHNTAEFGLYFILSYCLPLEDIPQKLYRKEEIRNVKIFLGCGWYDSSVWRDLINTYRMQEILSSLKYSFQNANGF